MPQVYHGQEIGQILTKPQALGGNYKTLRLKKFPKFRADPPEFLPAFRPKLQLPLWEARLARRLPRFAFHN